MKPAREVGRDVIVKVKVARPPLPTLWFDTSVGIDLAKLQIGERIDSPRKEKLVRFSEAVNAKVTEQKLLCVEGDQREEIQGERLEEMVRKTVYQLCEGIRFRHRIRIQQQHTFEAMKAYVAGVCEFEIDYNSFFDSEPVEELQENLDSQFLIDVHTTLSPGNLQRFRSTRQSTKGKLESLRVKLNADGTTYERQLEEERAGHANVMMNSVSEFYGKLQKGRFEGFEQVDSYHMLRHVLSLYRRDPETNFSHLNAFLTSPYYKALPTEDVSARLYADIVAGTRKAKSGDAMDVDLLSIALPVCHFVVADKGMVDRLERRKIAQDYDTRVFKTSTLDELSGLLERL